MPSNPSTSHMEFRPKTINNNSRVIIKKSSKSFVAAVPQSFPKENNVPKLTIKTLNIRGLLKQDKYRLKTPETEMTDMKRVTNIKKFTQSSTRGGTQSTQSGFGGGFMKNKLYVSPKYSTRNLRLSERVTACIPIHKLPELLNLNSRLYMNK